METYFLDIEKKEDKEIYSGHLHIGGENPEGDRIGCTNYYLELNGNPFFVIAGEFHYSRYPYEYWDEELQKMKLAGLNTVSSYVFWNFHEEDEGIFNWEDSNNLRRFLDSCKRNELYAILRIGPFCHGEVRNGGLPDWLYGRPFRVRSNDEGYLFYVRRLYGEISKQVYGNFFQDGGPVIALQLENEFLAAEAPWEFSSLQGCELTGKGFGGADHMKMLKEIADETGMQAPIYTSTAWSAPTGLENQILPLHGCYAFTPWIITEKGMKHPPTDNYLFRDYHRDNYSGVHTTSSKYPYGCCEMMGGMQAFYKHRCVVPPESVEALAINKIAGGCNFLGYYVFHGGSNPIGKHTYMNEFTTPKISYDFQAPLGEYGQIRDSYRFLRLLHYFVKDFEDVLCPMTTILPDGAKELVETDVETLRYAARKSGNSGFLFLCNYQDHMDTKDHKDIRMNLQLTDEAITFPRKKHMTVRSGISAVFPFNFNMDSAVLKYSTAQLITKLQEGDCTYFFFFVHEGVEAEYCFSRSGISDFQTDSGIIEEDSDFIYVYGNPDRRDIITMELTNKKHIRICTLTRKEALGLWKLNLWGKEHIVITDSDILVGRDNLQLLITGKSTMSFVLFPPADMPLETCYGKLHGVSNGIFEEYAVEVKASTLELEIKRVLPNKAVVTFPQNMFEGVNDIFLRIDYSGDVGNAFINGTLINDNFNNGIPWEIGLKRFSTRIPDESLYFHIAPLWEGEIEIMESSMALVQRFKGKETAEIHSIQALPQYKVEVAQANKIIPA